MPLQLGHEQLSWFFFFSSLERFLVVNNQPKWNRRVDCIWMWKKLQVLLIVLNDIAVEKTLIVTIDQKSCKRILICGSACICSSVFGLFFIYHYSFPEVLQVIAHLYCFFWNWEDSTSKFCIWSSSCTIYLSVVKRFCWNKCRAKGVLGYTTKDRKLLLVCVSQNSTSEF